MRKRLALTLLLLSLVMSACASSDEGQDNPSPGSNVVYVYNYGDYIDPDVIDMFEEETGITVVYDTFDTNEEMYPIISSGSVRYDVVCPSEYMVEKLLANDLLLEINFDNVPNFRYITDSCRAFAESYDSGNRHSVPYTWGTVGIMYDTDYIQEGEITSWADLWDEKYRDEVMMMDSLRDIYMIALKRLGYSANTTNEQELKEATDLLIQQKDLVYKYATDAIRDLLLNESAMIGIIYSGEVGYCMELDDTLEYVLPSEGSNVWFDSWVIPANCRSKENAEAWINFMCRPDIGLKTFEYLYYATPNSGTIELMEEEYPELMENTALFPDEETLEKCEIYHYLGSEADKMYNQYWKEFKAY